MKILAIESSCDDTSAAVVEYGRKVISIDTISQSSLHAKFGGVVPELASRGHLDSIYTVTKNVLKIIDIDIKKSFNKIDAIAVTNTPGLIGPLLVGVNFAKGISIGTGLPLIAVNHIKSHAAANYIESDDNLNNKLAPPYLCLMISGGNTQILNVKTYTDFEIIASSRDDAIGEVFDKIARAMNIEYPGGSTIDKLSEFGDPKKFKFTIPRLENLDFSFSGIKTKALEYIKSIDLNDINKKDISASFSNAVFGYLIKNLIIASNNYNYKKIAIAGGVASNRYFRKFAKKECEKNNIEFFSPDIKFCTDNAAMIGVQGYYEYINNNFANLEINAYSTKICSY